MVYDGNALKITKTEVVENAVVVHTTLGSVHVWVRRGKLHVSFMADDEYGEVSKNVFEDASLMVFDGE